ncbi:unnamed protein product [Brassica oleracea]
MNIELTPSSMTDSYSDLVSEPIEVKKQMPELSGNHPHLWISRMEQFCCAKKHTEDEKLNMILRSMHGNAIIWYT